MSDEGYTVRTNVRARESDLYTAESHVRLNASNCPSNHLWAGNVLGALKKLFSSLVFRAAEMSGIYRAIATMHGGRRST